MTDSNRLAQELDAVFSGEPWPACKARLEEAHRALVVRVGSLTQRELAAIVPGQSIAVREMIRGAIQHDVYHAGQLRLLQRLHEEVG